MTKTKISTRKPKKEIKPGYCAFGCGTKTVDGKRLCEEHLAHERDKINRYRYGRRTLGLCWRCNNPVRPGGFLCEEHRAEVRNRERNLREARRKQKQAAKSAA